VFFLHLSLLSLHLYCHGEGPWDHLPARLLLCSAVPAHACSSLPAPATFLLLECRQRPPSLRPENLYLVMRKKEAACVPEETAKARTRARTAAPSTPRCCCAPEDPTGLPLPLPLPLPKRAPRMRDCIRGREHRQRRLRRGAFLRAGHTAGTCPHLEV